MSRMYAISTCLPPNKELNAYLSGYLPFYCQVQRGMFQELSHGVLDQMKKAVYVSDVMERHGVLKRTVNSIIHDMQGRIKAYGELKNTELVELDGKLGAVIGRIETTQKAVDTMKPRAASNSLTEKELQQYRKDKESLYFLKNKKNRLQQRRDLLEKQIKEGKVSICFGSKDMFSKQFNLKENGFRSHEGWYNAFVKKRDSGIFLLGSKEERYGNQILQLQFNGKDFTMVLLKDKPFRADATKKQKNICLTIEHVSFPFMQNELQAAIKGKQPITYRITRKGHKWYLTAMFKMDVPLQTFRANGVYGIDYNDGFLEVAETDYMGNLVSAQHIPLVFHGTGNRAESELKEKLSRLVRLARSSWKDIVVENLKFTRKKSKTLPGRRKKGKNYNKMIHAFDYSRYLFWMENLCEKYGVGLTKVNPAYTSKTGDRKYAKPRKLTVHRAAALVIARRGQKFKD